VRIVFYRDRAELYRWRAVAGNNRTIAASGEGYHNLQDAEDAVFLLFTGVAPEIEYDETLQATDA
jgi:uncharacterized protein YegP (UPF0339 family)